MYCSNCGTVVVGKFCYCCGKKILTPLNEYRKHERKTLKAFLNSAGSDHSLANACWYACQRKYGKDIVVGIDGEFTVSPDAYKKLSIVEDHAKALFLRLMFLDDF